MAIVSGFDHDVIVSYAHIDNTPDTEGAPGWVDKFCDLLSVRLLKRFGKRIDVWRDPELNRAQRFDPVIEEAVRGSAVMISLLSESYLNSDYCAQEIDWFCEQLAGDTRQATADNFSLVFPVLLYDIEPDRWPQATQRTTGFALHDPDRHGVPLKPGSDAFEDQILSIVEELHTLLNTLKKPEPEPEAASDSSKPRYTVFLGAVADDLRPAKRLLADELPRHGIAVTGDVPPPYEPQEHADAVRVAVEGADLSIHLLGTRAGEPLGEESPDSTYPVEQVKVGREHAQSQLVLLPDGMHRDLIEVAWYRDWLQQLQHAEREQAQLEIMQTGKHQMVDEIVAKLKRLEEARQRDVEQAVGTAGMTAFVDLHASDVVNATGLIGELVQHQVVPIVIPSTDMSPTAGMSLFEEHLKRAKLFLVVYGTVAREWVMQRLIEASKLILINELPTKIGIYSAKPHETAELKFPWDVASDSDTLAAMLARVDG